MRGSGARSKRNPGGKGAGMRAGAYWASMVADMTMTFRSGRCLRRPPGAGGDHTRGGGITGGLWGWVDSD